MRTLSPFIVALVAAASLAGCLDPLPEAGPGGEKITDVRDRADLPFEIAGNFSRTLEQGPYAILPAVGAYIDVAAPFEAGPLPQRAHLGLFLPDVPPGTKVPVIADVGPYYGESDVHALEPADRLGRFLIENFVPHGYAVAQVSVLGTGDSEGCQDYLGPVEQAGVAASVDWLGQQEWSNGNVALIGRSYDGTTPWQAAMFASPHLKTIVPISGLTGLHELLWRNGSAETRAPSVMWGSYYTFAATGNQPDPQAGEAGDPILQARQIAWQAACPDATAGLPLGVAAYPEGDYGSTPAGQEYWSQRHFLPGVINNYRGSVYLIHGLQDWNVEPHMAFPAYQQLEEVGVEMKGLFGQWGHMYPDRAGEHEALDDYRPANTSLRWDWAQDLLEWFDHYLKGTGAKPALQVEVQDDHGFWRVEPSWPPRDGQWAVLTLGKDLTTAEDKPHIVAPGRNVVLASEFLETDMRIAGMPQLHIPVVPTGPGGQLCAELIDANTNHVVGWATMDLRFADGGREPTPVEPGMPLTAKMEFEPLDALVPAGHRLELVLSPLCDGYLPSVVNAPVEILVGAGSELGLPLIARAPEAFFEPPGYEGTVALR